MSNEWDSTVNRWDHSSHEWDPVSYESVAESHKNRFFHPLWDVRSHLYDRGSHTYFTSAASHCPASL